MNSDKHFFSGLLRKNIWIYFFSFLMAPMGYITKIIISNSVSVQELGTFYGVLSLMTILSTYNDFGTTESLNYFLPGYIHDKDTRKITSAFSVALFTNVVTSTTLSIFLFFGSHWLATHYFSTPLAGTLLQILIIQFFAGNIFSTLSAFFISIQDVRLQKFIEFLRLFLSVCATIALWFFDMNTIQTYAWIWSISILLGTVICMSFLISKYHSYFTVDGWRFSSSEFKHIIKYAFWVMLGANVGMLLSQIDMQMVITMLGTRDAGYYTNYLSMIRIPFLFLLPGVFFLFPVFTDLLKKKEERKIIAIHAFCYELFSIIALMMTSFFMIFGNTLTTTLFGEGYEVSGRILLYSSPFLIFNFLLQVDFQILSAMGRPRTKMFILLAAVVLNMVTNYIFIRLWGVVGSAFATGIGWAFIWTLTFHQTKQFSSSFRWAIFWQNAVGIGLLSWSFWNMHLEDYFHGRVQTLVGISLVLGIYGLVFAGLNWPEFKRFRRIFRSKHIIG